MPRRHEIDFDKILVEVGDFGRFQQAFYGFLCVIITLSTMPGVVALVFQAYVPLYRCRVPRCDNGTSPQYDAPFVNVSIPRSADGELSRCRRYWKYNLTLDTCAAADFDDNITVSCSEFVFDTSVFETSFATQWNLTCKFEALVELPNTLYFSGVLIGSFVFGVISDRFGRRGAVLLAVLLQNLSCYLIVLLRHSFIAVCVLRVIMGLASCGLFQTSFVLAVELVGKRWRVSCGTVLNYFTTLGALIAGGLGYAIRSWVELQLAVTVPLALLLIGYWSVPESVRWLLTQGKTREAEAAIRKMALRNGTTVSPHLLAVPDCADPYEEEEEEEETQEEEEDNGDTETLVVPAAPGETFADCMKHGTLRLRLVLALLGWFSVNFAFYGMVVDLPNLPGDFFLNCFTTTLAEIPGYTYAWWAMDRLGRRPTFASSTLICGAALIAAGLIPNSLPIPGAVMLMLGKSGASGSFAIIYIYTSELFPTSARNTAVGMCSMVGRIAAMLAPELAVLAVYGESIPLLVIGGVVIFSGMFTLMLPETLGQPLPETVQDAIGAPRARPDGPTAAAPSVNT